MLDCEKENSFHNLLQYDKVIVVVVAVNKPIKKGTSFKRGTP